MNQPYQKSPLLSVVMPNFNCIDFLPAALQCVKQQNITGIEVLVVDDGSTDGSKEWLRNQAKYCPNLRVFETERLGPAAARNLAVQKAKGKYIAFLDSDDKWHANKLSKQVAFLERHPKVSFSFTNFQQISESNEHIGDGFSLWEHFISNQPFSGGYTCIDQPLSALYRDNPVGTSTVVARRESILKVGGFDESLPSAEDIDLWLKLTSVGDVACSNRIETDYLVRDGSESSKTRDRMNAMTLIGQRFADKVRVIDADAIPHFEARLQSAMAQIHRAHFRFLSAFVRHCRAFCYLPTKRHLKAALVDLLKSFSRS